MKPIQVRVSGKVPAQVKQPPAKAKAKSSEPTQGGFDLQGFLDQMNKKFGTGSVIRASEAIGLKLKYLSTGCARLDLALGGGWPQNRMTEMFGSESAGKTTLILKTIAKFQQSYPQGVAVLIDLERSFDPVYCKALHIDLRKLIVISPDQGEQASDMLDEVLKLNVDLFIAVDSIAAMTPTITVENSAQKVGVGDHPRLINKVFARCNARMKRNLVDKDAPTVTVVFLNQEREKVGILFGDSSTTPGGKGKNFFSSVRLKLFTSGANAKKIVEAVTRNGVTRQVTIAKITSFQVVKNKAGGKPFEEGEFTYYVTPTSVHRQFEYDDAEALFAAGRFYGHIKTTPMGFSFDEGAVGPFKKESAFISKLASSEHVMNKLLAQCLQSVREEDPMSQLEDTDDCAISEES